MLRRPRRATGHAAVMPLAPRTPLLLTTLLALAPATGCGFAVDTPLGVEDVPAAVAPGEPVTGRVIYPDGDITVTIGPAQRGLAQDARVEGAVPCEYADERLSCPTDGLTEGVHAVQVTDAAQPGELVQTAYVAVSSRPGYDPEVTSAPVHPAAREVFDARLTGWGAGQELRLRVLHRGRVVQRLRVTTDGSGTAAVEVGRAGPAAYEVRGRDGIWGEGEAPAYSVWLPS